MDERKATPRSGSSHQASPVVASINRVVSPDHAVGRALIVGRIRWQLLTWRPSSADERAARETISRLAPAFTMVALPRLRRLLSHVEVLHRDGVAGAVVECGTWRGGSLALIDWAFRRRGDQRVLWAFDSFEGLPIPGERDPLSARSGFFPGWCAATEEDVERALGAVSSTSERHLVKGWLAETLPHAVTGPIALLNLDVDWYDSVRTALVELYDRVAPRGIINFDDYGRWSGCDEAVHDFLTERGMPLSLIERGRHGAWIRKPEAARSA